MLRCSILRDTRMYFYRQTLVAALLSVMAAAVHAEAPVAVQADAGTITPHASVIRKFGWETAGLPDFSVLRADVALAQRAAGAAHKAVFVLSRGAGGHDLLVVSESALTQRPKAVEALVALHEQARQWLVSHPEEAARLVAADAGIGEAHAATLMARRDFSVSRPGPSLAHALKSNSNGASADVVDALLADQPIRAAARKLEQVADASDRQAGRADR